MITISLKLFVKKTAHLWSCRFFFLLFYSLQNWENEQSTGTAGINIWNPLTHIQSPFQSVIEIPLKRHFFRGFFPARMYISKFSTKFLFQIIEKRRNFY